MCNKYSCTVGQGKTSVVLISLHTGIKVGCVFILMLNLDQRWSQLLLQVGASLVRPELLVWHIQCNESQIDP